MSDFEKLLEKENRKMKEELERQDISRRGDREYWRYLQEKALMLDYYNALSKAKAK